MSCVCDVIFLYFDFSYTYGLRFLGQSLAQKTVEKRKLTEKERDELTEC